MASLNVVMLLGNVCKEIELRYSQGGTAIASFTLATNDRVKNKSGEWEDKAEFHNIVAFGRTAEIASEFLGKGKQCHVTGSLQTRKWQDKDSRDRWTTEIKVDKLVLLGGKGEGGNKGQGGGGQQSQGDDYPTFNPDDDIPFS